MAVEGPAALPFEVVLRAVPLTDGASDIFGRTVWAVPGPVELELTERDLGFTLREVERGAARGASVDGREATVDGREAIVDGREASVDGRETRLPARGAIVLVVDRGARVEAAWL